MNTSIIVKIGEDVKPGDEITVPLNVKLRQREETSAVPEHVRDDLIGHLLMIVEDLAFNNHSFTSMNREVERSKRIARMLRGTEPWEGYFK